MRVETETETENLQRTISQTDRPSALRPPGTWLDRRYLIPQCFLGREAEGVHLGELVPQVVVQLPELCVAPVHIPLVVMDTDVHLEIEMAQPMSPSS